MIIGITVLWSQPNPPGSPATPNPAQGLNQVTPVITGRLAELRTKADASFDWWKKNDGGAEFHAGLTYVNGNPILMWVTTPGESASRSLHRKRSIVLACDFLLDDAAFQEATLCVVELDARRSQPQVLNNYRVRRADFQRAATTAAPIETVKGAAQKARTDDTVAIRICAELGIK